MKSCCISCQSVYQGKQDFSCHPSLITVWAKEEPEGELLYVFFCKDCDTLLSMKLTMENPMEDKISFFTEEMTEEFIDHLALALWAENRREQFQLRIDFLKNRMIPIYEPIDEEEFERIKESQDTTVIKTPYFPQWYDNIEDALRSFDEEEEWEESFSFSYAEPLDLHIISFSQKIPRYYRTYLVPADEIEAMLRIETNEPSRLSIWKQTVSRIEKVSIWDEKQKQNIQVEDFSKGVLNDDLWLEVSQNQKEQLLKPYKEWIREKFPNNIVL